MMRLIREARRRRVFRVAALYIVGAWLLLQVADVLFPAFGIEATRISVLVYAALLGFPVALVFGWMFDVTKDGIRRTSPAAAGDEPGSLALKRSDYAILAALTVVAAFIVYGLSTEIPPPGSARPDKLDNSIAVLTFANIGNDPENEAFSHGMSEEIRQRLGHFTELNIIGRTSIEAVKDEAISTIAEFLGTRFLLQGSVRRAGDQLRISTVLLDDRGVQLWSASYDRRLENVFEMQTEIADAVAKTIVPQIVSTSRRSAIPDLDAYEHYLKGRELLHVRQRFRAFEDLRKAIEIDPQFAGAHAELAIALAIGTPSDEELEEARQLADTALSLRPGMTRALAAKGLLFMQQREPDWKAAELLLRQVVEQDPNMSDGLLWLSNTLSALKKDEESFTILERAARLDPLHPSIVRNYSADLFERGEDGRAELFLLQVLAASGDGPVALVSLYTLYERRGQLNKAIETAKHEVLSGAAANYYQIAKLYAKIGDWESSEYWLQRSKEDHPHFFGTPFFDAALVCWQGRYAEAARLFRQAIEADNRSLEDLELFLRLWLGWIQGPSNQHELTIEVLEPVIIPETVHEAADNLILHASQALAWAYMETGHTDKAAMILETLDNYFAELDQDGLLFHAALIPYYDGYYRYALNTRLMGDLDLALDRLEQAIELGWRGYYLNHHDPRWDILRDNPRFKELMAFVKADVDRQRAEQRRVDAEDDFIDRLDARMAAEADE
jgi:TolB-like protein/Tfp pilus assembly protein PilF